MLLRIDWATRDTQILYYVPMTIDSMDGGPEVVCYIESVVGDDSCDKRTVVDIKKCVTVRGSDTSLCCCTRRYMRKQPNNNHTKHTMFTCLLSFVL